MSYLLDLVRLSIDDVSIEKISGHIGQDPITTTEAIDAALPMLVGALSRRAREDGASELSGVVDRGRHGEILDDVAGYVETGDRADGRRILRHIFGPHQESVARVLGASSGLEKSQASTLMITLAPVLLGAIGKAKQVRSIGPGELSQMLFNEELDLERRSPDLMHAVWGLLDKGEEMGLDELAKLGARGLGRIRRD